MTHDALRITSPYNGTLLASTVVAGIATAYRGPVRCVPHDPSIREFSISDRGIEVATTFESAEAILTGWHGRYRPAMRSTGPARF